MLLTVPSGYTHTHTHTMVSWLQNPPQGTSALRKEGTEPSEERLVVKDGVQKFSRGSAASEAEKVEVPSTALGT